MVLRLRESRSSLNAEEGLLVEPKKIFITTIAFILANSVNLVAFADQTAKPKAKAVVASWYGDEYFQGRTMYCGEKFNMNDPSIVAHMTLPCNTRVTFTNPENGKTVTAIVKDRGDFPKGRSFDLSHAAAQRLGYIKKGVTTLLVIVHTNS